MFARVIVIALAKEVDLLIMINKIFMAHVSEKCKSIVLVGQKTRIYPKGLKTENAPCNENKFQGGNK